MNDQHDNEADDKAMLERFRIEGKLPPAEIRRERRGLGSGVNDLLDWVDGLNEEAATQVLQWLATNRPAQLRDAKRARERFLAESARGGHRRGHLPESEI